MNKQDFIKLTEKNTEGNLYLKRENVLIVTPLTSQLLHKDDYNFEEKKTNMIIRQFSQEFWHQME